MTDQSIYSEKIKELTIFKEKPISSDLILIWLDLNWNLYINISDYNSCSHRRSPFPCFCCVKNDDCLFLKIYTELHIIENYISYDIKSKLLLQEYSSIESNYEKVKKWTKINYDFAINRLRSFENYDDNRILRRSFINGKNIVKDEFNYIYIYVCLKNFEHNYQFRKIFNQLFFVDKILPKELDEYMTELNKFYDE